MDIQRLLLQLGLPKDVLNLIHNELININIIDTMKYILSSDYESFLTVLNKFNAIIYGLFTLACIRNIYYNVIDVYIQEETVTDSRYKCYHSGTNLVIQSVFKKVMQSFLFVKELQSNPIYYNNILLIKTYKVTHGFINIYIYKKDTSLILDRPYFHNSVLYNIHKNHYEFYHNYKNNVPQWFYKYLQVSNFEMITRKISESYIITILLLSHNTDIICKFNILFETYISTPLEFFIELEGYINFYDTKPYIHRYIILIIKNHEALKSKDRILFVEFMDNTYRQQWCKEKNILFNNMEN